MTSSVFEFSSQQLHHPFSFIIAGGTQSGKTTFVTKLIKHLDNLVVPRIDDVIVFYKKYQPAYDMMKESDSRVRCIEGLDLTNIRANNTLVVIDDLMTDSLKDKKVQELFTSGVHHR